MRLNEFSTVDGPKGPKDYGQPNSSRYIGSAKFVVGTTHNYILTATVEKWGLAWDEDDEIWFLDSSGSVSIADASEGEIELPDAMTQHLTPGNIHDLVSEYLNDHNSSDLQKVAAYFGHSPDGEMATEGVRVANQQIPGTTNRAKTTYYPTNVPPKVKKLDKPLTDKELSRLTNQGVKESEEHSPVANAITRRILLQRTDLLAKYGPEKVTAAIDEVADFVGDTEEMGTSDVSGWIRHVEQILGNMSQGVAESEKRMSRAAKGYEKYGKEGMRALAKAGREGKDLDKIRDKYNKYDKGVSEAMTPPGEFLSKAERLKAGDKVIYKGKVVGIATGEINDNKIIFKPSKDYGNDMIASLPIDEISLREGRHNPLDPYQRDQENSTVGFNRPEEHRDDERHDLDPVLIYALKINGKIWKQYGETVTFFTKERALSARNSMLNKNPELEITLLQREKD